MLPARRLTTTAILAAAPLLAACGPAAETATPLPSGFEVAAAEIVDEIDAFWAASDLIGDGYAAPSVRPYRTGTLPQTVCAEATQPVDWVEAAYYCFADTTLVYDADWLAALHAEGAGVAIAVLAHEWGHHVQGLTTVPDRSLQRELQADCYAGVYLAPPLGGDEDLTPALDSLERLIEAGNQEYRQSAWFDLAEHGSPGLRWSSYLTGLLTFRDPSACAGHATYEPEPPVALGGFTVAHLPGAEYETDGDRLTIRVGEIEMRLIRIAPEDMPPADAAPEDQLAATFARTADPMNFVYAELTDAAAEDRPSGPWLGLAYEAEPHDRPVTVRAGLVRLFRAESGEGLVIDAFLVHDPAGPPDTGLPRRMEQVARLPYQMENFLCLPGQTGERGQPGYYFSCDIEVPE